MYIFYKKFIFTIAKSILYAIIKLYLKKEFSGKVGIIMAISGIGGSMPQAVTFRTLNTDANFAGKEATENKMREAKDPVSNFGNETHLGTGQTSQILDQVANEAVEAMSTIMQQDDDFENPVNGSGTAFTPIHFQEANNTAFDPAMQRAASSYQYFNQ